MISSKGIEEFNRLSKDSKNFANYVSCELAQQLSPTLFKRQRAKIKDVSEFLCKYYFAINLIEDPLPEILLRRFSKLSERRGSYFFACQKIINCFEKWLKMYNIPAQVVINDDYSNVYEEFFIKDLYLAISVVSQGKQPIVSPHEGALASITGLMMSEGNLFSFATLSHEAAERFKEIIESWKKKTLAMSKACDVPVKMIGTSDGSWRSENLVIL